MRIAYFDCFSGISGDMTVGALLNAGLPLQHLKEELAKLDLEGYSIGSRIIERSMIAATKFDVDLNDASHDHHLEAAHSQHDHDAHRHSHGHSHDHSHDHSHEDHALAEQHVHEHGLSYAVIRDLIAASRLSDSVKQRSQNIFRVIAEAEAVIHGVTLETVHFHEVGAIDSIVDIVSTVIGLDHFAIDECRSRVVPLGAGGFVRTAHGKMPIPTPATLAILAGYPTELGNVHSEMTTPTGAGIIKALSGGVLQKTETLHVEVIGYGAGTKDFTEQPNLLRLVIGELDSENDRHAVFPDSDTVMQLTACIDDMPPTQIAYAQERLLEAGALDAYIRPILMKKGRPAHELVILSPVEVTEDILNIVARETTTIGIRTEEVRRRKAKRSLGEFEHPRFGAIRIKTVQLPDGVHREPEFEEVKRISMERGLPFQFVLEQIRKDLQ